MGVSKNYVALCCAILLIIIASWGARLYNTGQYGQNTNTLPFVSLLFSPDQISQQTILHNWQEGYGERAITGDDNWIVKWPIYWVANNLPLEPFTQQFVTVFVILTITAVGLFAAALFLIRQMLEDRSEKVIATVVVGLIMVAIPGITFEYIVWPNSRNIELAMYFWLVIGIYMFFDNYSKKDSRKSIKIGIATTVLATTLFFDDPLFMYITVPLLIGILFVRYLSGLDNVSKKMGLMYAGIILSIGGMYALRTLLSLITPHSTYMHRPSQFDAQTFMSNVLEFFTEGLQVIGINMQIGGQPRLSLIYSVVCASVAACALLGIVASLYRRPKLLFNHYMVLVLLWNCFLVGLMGPVITEDRASSRYNTALVVIEIIGCILFIKYFSLKRQKILLLGASSVAAVVSIVFVFQTMMQPKVNAYSLAIDDTVTLNSAIKKEGLRKGYSISKYGNIMTYLSDYDVQYVPSICLQTVSGGPLEVRYLDILTEIGVKNKLKVDKSFYLYIESEDRCALKDISKQFGKPEKEVAVQLNNGETARILVYDYDISRKIAVQKLE